MVCEQTRHMQQKGRGRQDQDEILVRVYVDFTRSIAASAPLCANDGQLRDTGGCELAKKTHLEHALDRFVTDTHQFN